MRNGDPLRAVYPITRAGGEILGYPVYGSFDELPEAPDLALLSIPAEGTPEVIAQAAAAGVKTAVVFACGFAEAGDAGKELQDRVVQAASGSQLRIVGPNCMGICDLHAKLMATYFSDLPTQPGEVGFISQSGAFGGIAFADLYRAGVGISKFASIGNMSDVSHAELIGHYAADDSTKVIAAFIEGVSHGVELLDAIAAATPLKPVVILKGARTETGRAAAVSHTGSLAGESRVWDALLREAGAIVAEDTEDLFDAAATLARYAGRLPRGKSLAIATISGGPAVAAADVCERYALELPNLDEALSECRSLVPPFASLRNPVDFTSQIKREDYAPAVAAVASRPEVDVVLAINVGLNVAEFAEAFVDVPAKDGKPVVGFVIGPALEAIFAAAGIPNLPSVERAVRAASRLCSYAEIRGRPDTGGPRYRFDPSPITGVVVGEFEAKRLLAGHGFKVAQEEQVGSWEEALAAADRIGYPVVLKVSSDAVTHKTDAGGVFLHLRDGAALAEAWGLLTSRFPDDPALVQAMVGGGVELILGARRDDISGPTVMVGAGGVLAEILDDVTFARAPLSPGKATEAVNRLEHQALLEGPRGTPAVDREELRDLLERLSAFLVANPSLTEIDVNPVIATSDGLVAVDALLYCG